MLKGKNSIVTGANRGIGRAIVEKFAQNGCNVWACCRKANIEFEREMEDLSNKYGVWIKPIYFDLENSEAIIKNIQSIIDERLPIHILVNNAGVSTVNLLSLSKIEDIQRIFDINYFSILKIIQKVSKTMIRQRHGVIINMASLAGVEPQPGKIAYGSSKAAVIMMTKCLAKELGPMNIRVNEIAPGPIETEMIHQYNSDMLEKLKNESAMRRLGRKEEIAQVAVFLSSESASYINGEVIKVDGGR